MHQLQLHSRIIPLLDERKSNFQKVATDFWIKNCGANKQLGHR